MNTDNTNDKPAHTSFGEQWEDDVMNDDAQHVNVLQDKVAPIQNFDNIVSLDTPSDDMPAEPRSLDIKMLFAPSMPLTDNVEHTETEYERDPDTMKALKEKYKGYRLTASDDDWISNEDLTDEQLAKMLCDNEALLLEIESERNQSVGNNDKAHNHTQPVMPNPAQSDIEFNEWCESADMVHADIKTPETVDELSQAVDNNQYDYMFDRQYQITATGRQVDDLSFACETMARIEIGQMNAIIDALPLKGDTDTHALLHQIEYLLKPYIKPNLPHSPFFTMHQSLRHRRSWDIHPEGGMTVNFDEPLILDPKAPLLDVVLVEHELTQDIFKGQPDHILSAHIDENGTAMLSQCLANELTVHQGRHICLKAGVWQYSVGKGYKTDNWQASPINRVF